MLLLNSIIAASLTVSGATKKASNLTKEPNFIFILADDMGWTGTSVPSMKGDKSTKSDFYETPNLQRLAEYGMTFSNAYAPAAMCTPSRASLLTGKTCARLRMTTPGPVQTVKPYNKVVPGTHLTDLPEGELTIAEALQKSGYKTAHFGKWHLKGGGPGKHGFDVHDGEVGNPNQTFPPDNPKDMFGITERSIKFMKECKQKKQPFYVQLSHYAVHTVCESMTSTKSYFDDKKPGKQHSKSDLAAMTKGFDTTVGLVLDYLKESGLYQNTFLIFMSDNGAPSRRSESENYPLKSGKSSLFEGGIRVPMIVAGPYVKSNSYCDKNVIGYDLFPTIWSLAKLEKKYIQRIAMD